MQLALLIRHVGNAAKSAAVALIDFKPQYLVRRFWHAQRLKDELPDFSLVEFTADFTVIAPRDSFFTPITTGDLPYLLLEGYQADASEVMASEVKRVVFGHGDVWWSCFMVGGNDLFETPLLREEVVLKLILREGHKG